MHALVYAAPALVGLWLLGQAGRPGRALRHMVVWGALGLALYVALDALALPQALRVSPNAYTVASAALLGAPGVGLALFAHALFPSGGPSPG